MAIDRSFRTLAVSLLGVSVWCGALDGSSYLQAGLQNGENPPPSAFTVVDGVAEHTIGRNDVLLVTVWNGLTTDEKSVRVAED
ncbi:MAG: hypothetical protein V3R94_05030, partial [Acidobacteriota bacterium]